MVGGVEADVPEPASDHCDVHAGRDQMYGSRMPEAVRRDVRRLLAVDTTRNYPRVTPDQRPFLSVILRRVVQVLDTGCFLSIQLKRFLEL